MSELTIPKNDFKTICRCCLSLGNFKNINLSYKWMENDEIYTEMILECFNFELKRLDQIDIQSAICEICITQLRSAYTFRQQVLDSEINLLEKLVNSLVRPDDFAISVECENIEDSKADINIELSDNDTVSLDSFDKDFLDSLKDNKLEIIKTPELVKPKNRVKGSQKNLNKIKKEIEETDGKLEIGETPELVKPKKRVKGSQINLKKTKKEIEETDEKLEIGETPELVKPKKRAKGNEKKLKKPKTEIEETDEKLEIVKTPELVKSKKRVKGSQKLLQKTKREIEETDEKLDIVETPELVKPKKRAKGNEKKLKKLKEEIEETDEKLEILETPDLVKPEKTVKDSKKNIKKPKKEIKEIDTPIRKRNSKSDLKALQISAMNSELLLRHCTACPFRWSCQTGFRCLFCKIQIRDTDELRTHTKTHKNIKLCSLLREQFNTIALVKVDITDLKCSICDMEVDNLIQAKAHLREIHSKVFDEDYKDRLAPVILTNSESICRTCDARFDEFHMLNKHLNMHYDNFVCESCGATFLSDRRLSRHMSTHSGIHYCTICDKKCSSLSAVQNHENKVHKKKPTYICHCGLEFMTFYSRKKHRIDEHDEKKLLERCEACSIDFYSKSSYYTHYRRHHLKERNHPCDYCELEFFSSSELKDHVLKHTQFKFHECEICNKAFGRKDTLMQHLRIHSNDRKYACDNCNRTFIQKCSLKAHMGRFHK